MTKDITVKVSYHPLDEESERAFKDAFLWMIEEMIDREVNMRVSNVRRIEGPEGDPCGTSQR